MHAGKLRHRLIIEQATEARDTLGQAIETWAEFAAAWGSLEAMSGRERFLSSQTTAESTHVAKIRYLSGVTEKMRVVYDGKTYDIRFIDPRGNARRELWLYLTEGLHD